MTRQVSNPIYGVVDYIPAEVRKIILGSLFVNALLLTVSGSYAMLAGGEGA